LLVAGVTLWAAGAAWGVPQTKDQQKCITKVNRAGLKVHEMQAGANRACVKDFGRGGLEQPTAELCLTDDPKGKVLKAQGKTTAAANKFCVGAGVPDFGYSGDANVNTQTKQAEIDLMHDLFGNPVDPGLFTCDPATDECLCQRNMINRIEEVMKVIPRVFLRCKKVGLKEGADDFPNGIASVAELQQCFDDPGLINSVATDPGGQIAEVVEFFTNALNDECEATGVTAVAFPGPACPGLSGIPARDCLIALARCRTCLMINAIDGLSSDCDTFDNAAADVSCPP
jgi:hypothetical protein